MVGVGIVVRVILLGRLGRLPTLTTLTTSPTLTTLTGGEICARAREGGGYVN
jgi:hypothetical protein